MTHVLNQEGQYFHDDNLYDICPSQTQWLRVHSNGFLKVVFSHLSNTIIQRIDTVSWFSS